MKHPPTLADACVVSALDRKAWGGADQRSVAIREVLLTIPKARKFVLDRSMSRYLVDMDYHNAPGSLRKRIRVLDNLRQLARAPHSLTWIEFDYTAYLERGNEIHGDADPQPNTPRVGWLVQQHPRIETAFRATEFYPWAASERVFVQPLSAAWCSDDNPSPWPRWSEVMGNTASLITAAGYASSQVHFTTTVRPDISNYLVRALTKRDNDYGAGTVAAVTKAIKPLMSLGTLWGLLATLNDLPVVIENVTPSRGYVARGNYKKFLEHSVVRLNIPETQYRKLALKTAALIRRRAHQVRGFWRRDWRHPLSPLCAHDFDDQMICRRCHGRKIWIHEHQRGDASIGFVTHDYSVHANQGN